MDIESINSNKKHYTKNLLVTVFVTATVVALDWYQVFHLKLKNFSSSQISFLVLLHVVHY